MFDFTLIHVPAAKHIGPDALSRRPLGEGEEVRDEDDSWLDGITLFTKKIEHEEYLPAIVLTSTIKEEKKLLDIYHFLTTLEAPNYSSPQDQRRFIKRATQSLSHYSFNKSK
jgi:hypothetical protein